MRKRIAGIALATTVAFGGIAVAPTADAQPSEDRTERRQERLQNLIDEGIISEDQALSLIHI